MTDTEEKIRRTFGNNMPSWISTGYIESLLIQMSDGKDETPFDDKDKAWKDGWYAAVDFLLNKLGMVFALEGGLVK